jgi:hypothetical protein
MVDVNSHDFSRTLANMSCFLFCTDNSEKKGKPLILSPSETTINEETDTRVWGENKRNSSSIEGGGEINENSFKEKEQPSIISPLKTTIDTDIRSKDKRNPSMERKETNENSYKEDSSPVDVTDTKSDKEKNESDSDTIYSNGVNDRDCLPPGATLLSFYDGGFFDPSSDDKGCCLDYLDDV